MPRVDLNDIAGRRFGSRIAIAYAGNKKWHAQCDCGQIFITDGADLRRRNYLCNHKIEARFFAKVRKTDSCWHWTGALNSDGYGSFKNGKETTAAHIYSWRIVNGPTPPNKELDHLCRNRSCVNPAHLEPVTHAENVRRGMLGQVTKARFAKERVPEQSDDVRQPEGAQAHERHG